MNSRQVKSWLKNQGVPVKHIRSIGGKRNGQRVVYYIEARAGSLTEIFPIEMRERMLKIIYGDNFDNRNGRWIAGNISPHMASMTPIQWMKLTEMSE